MSEKRRDRKNLILRTGESQEADGRYKFRDVDANGKRKSVYSWRLVATDPIPSGKRDNPPLREQEKVINRDYTGRNTSSMKLRSIIASTRLSFRKSRLTSADTLIVLIWPSLE